MTRAFKVTMALFVLLMLALLMLALYGYLTGAWETQAQPAGIIAIPEKYETRLVELDRRAVEAAYEAHVRALFLSWMKDPSDQPERALQGVARARRTYVDSITAVERREERR
jgi:hypothetical protein